jgi:tRNA-2-methylthio-N6-dimethylallyladenosine synthase
MNVYDSVRMADVMAPHGYQASDDIDDADLVILNTCHIREKATEKVYSELGRLRARKDEAARAGRRMLIGVAGCVAQAEGEEIVRRAPVVDLVFGPQTYHRLPEMVSRALDRPWGKIGAGVVDTDFPADDKFDFLPEEGTGQGASSYLSVQEGCDKFCTFCVVPYTRGAEFSRPAESILAEARRMVAGGSVEITLLGQNVNAYHGEGPSGADWGLGRLIRALAEIDGLERIRYTTSHPRDMDDDLIAAHGEVPALMPYLHLPVQSGSDRVLEAMNRKHTADDYRRIIDRLRTVRSDLALSSDFIVGFPGEGNLEFAETLKLVREVGYAQAYSFMYSSRPGTPAAEIDDQIPNQVKSDRLQSLQQLLNAQQIAFNRSVIGSVQPVLLERRGNREGQLIGRGPWMQSVHTRAPERLLGTIADVRIEDGHANSISGSVEIIDAHHHEPHPQATAPAVAHSVPPAAE